MLAFPSRCRPARRVPDHRVRPVHQLLQVHPEPRLLLVRSTGELAMEGWGAALTMVACAPRADLPRLEMPLLRSGG